MFNTIRFLEKQDYQFAKEFIDASRDLYLKIDFDREKVIDSPLF